MEGYYTLSGGAFVVKKYMAGTTIANGGVPVIGSVASTTDLNSVEPMAANTALTAGNVGLTLDATGTVSATSTEAAATVSVIVNPDLVIRAKMSQGTTEDTALTLRATTSADATGVTANGVTTIDDGVIWGFDGANAGRMRRPDDTAGSVSMAFDRGIANGDRFLTAAGFPCAGTNAANGFLQLTTLLTQVDASATDSDNDNFIIVGLQCRDQSDDGQTNSFYELIANQHLFGSRVAS